MTEEAKLIALGTNECSYFIGAERTAPCKRCGGSWQQHDKPVPYVTDPDPASRHQMGLQCYHCLTVYPVDIVIHGELDLRRRQSVYSLALAVLMTVVLLATRIAIAADSEVDHTVQILGLKPDSRVADVGAGSGEISVALASRVPRGIVYSTEVDPQLIDKIRNRVRKARASNVIVITGRADDTQLPIDCCDGIFLRKVYHHLTNPAAMDRSLYRSVRPDGRLAIIDFEPLPGTRPPAGVPANRSGHGVPKRIVEQELTAVGFELLKTIDWPMSSTVKHYCMLFRKPRATLVLTSLNPS